MQNKYFDISSKKEAVKQENSSGHHIAKYLLAHYEKIKNLDKDLKRLPSADEFFFLHSDVQFNAFTFILFVSKYSRIKKLHATTYSINRKVIDALIQLYDSGKIEQIEVMVSDSLKRSVSPIRLGFSEELFHLLAGSICMRRWLC